MQIEDESYSTRNLLGAQKCFSVHFPKQFPATGTQLFALGGDKLRAQEQSPQTRNTFPRRSYFHNRARMIKVRRASSKGTSLSSRILKGVDTLVTSNEHLTVSAAKDPKKVRGFLSFLVFAQRYSYATNL